MKVPTATKTVIISIEDYIVGEDAQGVRHSGGVTRDKNMAHIFSSQVRRGVDIVRVFEQWTPEGEHNVWSEGLTCQE